MFAVIDVETTGLRPGGRDRVVELAVIRVGADGGVVDEWSTLVDPGCAVRGTRIHGIYTRDVQGAPTFGDIAGDLAERLTGTVLVAHNARFDSAFVEAEYRRLGHDLPGSWLCTLDLVERLGFSACRSLQACCANLGVAHEDGHAALVDARATACLLTFLVAAAYERESTIPMPLPLDLSGLDAIAPSGRQLHRPTRGKERAAPALARVAADPPIASVPAGADPAAVLAYTELLDRVLEDRMIVAEEALALCHLAGSWGLSVDHLRAIHRSYMGALVAVAMADGRLSRDEHDDLVLFAATLGVDRQVVLDDIARALPS